MTTTERDKKMNVTLYRNTSDKRQVSKSLSTVKSGIVCNIKHDCSILNPRIVIAKSSAGNWNNANYMYIDTFRRYYYIDNVTVTTAGELVIDGSVDVLMSNASAIRQLNCVILRQEHKNNGYFQDANIAGRVKRKYVYKQIGALPKAETNVLTVDGGV